MKIVTAANGKKFLRMTKQEWINIGLKFEEARRKKGLGRGPCGKGKARGKSGGKGGAGPGYGKGNATGPRSKSGTCPKLKS